MERMTVLGETALIRKETLKESQEGYSGLAAERLARFEDCLEDLLNQQKTITLELAQLKSQEKEKTVRFREAFARKLINTQVLMVLKRYGLVSKEDFG